MTKCSHDSCKNNAVNGSEYCNRCIQLPTKLCNFCNTGDPTYPNDPAYPFPYDAKYTLLINILVELLVCLPLSALITGGLVICILIAKFIAEYTTGIPFVMVSGENILAGWFILYLLLFFWVRIGSMKIKWSN